MTARSEEPRGRLQVGDTFAWVGVGGQYNQPGERRMLELDSCSVSGALQFHMTFRDGDRDRVVLTAVGLSEFLAMLGQGIVIRWNVNGPR